ncbi:MAG TPA: S46 family peptidase, partial [Chryseosolibacter sp.]|nr:S46 family peptidase [Chryseosolibacter sp.]
SYENGVKAYGGQLEGLRDPYIMARRAAFEEEFQRAVSKPGSNRPEKKAKASPTIWSEIAKTQNEIEKIYYDATLFAPTNGLNSRAFDMATLMNIYAMTTDEKRSKALKDFLSRDHNIVRETETSFLNAHIKEVNKYLGINDPYLSAILKHGNPDVAAKELIDNTKIYDLQFRKDLLEKGPKAITASGDPLLAVTRMAASRYESAQAKLKQLNSKMASLRSTLGLMLYDAYGLKIPPDATFSLRIADGLVRPYEYNGTRAPVFTTYYGLYDRFYSFEGEYPWSLPEKWMNPSSELLKAPINFVSTNDIIGGNSGSPIVNRNREVVGLVFDSNMEGLPGDYIYLPESARTVSVHAGGIIAGLKYIYKADRIASELTR